MLIDFRAFDGRATLEADICVVGAGAAGIAIAVSLCATRHQVLLVESGGLEPDPKTQALYEGELAGVPWGTSLASSRGRFFGGTTNWWPGGCCPLDAMDFACRPWIPHSGWPISREDLDPWYDRARPLLGLPDTPMDDAGPIDRDAPTLALDPERFVHRKGMRARTPRFGSAHRARLKQARNVRVLLHANLVELSVNESATLVSEARIRALDGSEGRVRARSFVLACGGIENARLLLLSNTTVPAGLGNGHDLVGRFFMDHPSGRLGTITSPTPSVLADPYNREVMVRGAPRPGEISLSRAIQTKDCLLNARVRPQDYENEEAVPVSVRAARQFAARVRGSDSAGSLPSLAWCMATGGRDLLPAIYRRLTGQAVVPSHRVELEGFFEQAPNPDSRVTLTDTIDALGQRKVKLEWQLTELDWRTYRAAGSIFAAELERLRLGELELDPWVRPGANCTPQLQGMAHHLGTTRMSDDPRTGVVNRDCRVHGIDNLHVVGGSVFPTGGWAPPTFTIVALAVRLADLLRRQAR
ncbi:MAG: GMC oxidoreductase [Acetobacteraceae bacterium]